MLSQAGDHLLEGLHARVGGGLVDDHVEDIPVAGHLEVAPLGVDHLVRVRDRVGVGVGVGVGVRARSGLGQG